VLAEMLERLEIEPYFLNQVITGYYSSMTLKQRGRVRHGTHHSLQDKESSHDQIKNQDNGHHLFFNSRGVVHQEFVPPGVTVNQKYYLEVLDHLRKRVMQVGM
jgi:hypothetical protein